MLMRLIFDADATSMCVIVVCRQKGSTLDDTHKANPQHDMHDPTPRVGGGRTDVMANLIVTPKFIRLKDMRTKNHSYRNRAAGNLITFSFYHTSLRNTALFTHSSLTTIRWSSMESQVFPLYNDLHYLLPRYSFRHTIH